MLGYNKNDIKNKTTANSRNGSYKKGVRSSLGDLSLNIPRDRNGEHEPLIVKKDKQMFHLLMKELFTSDITSVHVAYLYPSKSPPSVSWQDNWEKNQK